MEGGSCSVDRRRGFIDFDALSKRVKVRGAAELGCLRRVKRLGFGRVRKSTSNRVTDAIVGVASGAFKAPATEAVD
jgi:hypothetical protein